MVSESRAVLELPDEQKFKRDLEAINRFQKIVHANMVKDQDFGVIPGTQKPTLLKPGAEKITKLLRLADTYDILDRQENWQDGFFRYLVKCILIHLQSGATISEGLGECNSMESKYRYRWLWASEVPEGFDKDKAVKRWVGGRGGGRVPQYRVDNDEIYSQVNTVLKMAKKRSLVDAALSAGRLSNVFTQDIEDMALPRDSEEVESTEEEHICPIHNVPFIKRGKMKWWAHKIEGTDEWCNEAKPKEQAKPVETTGTETPATTEPSVSPTYEQRDELINLDIRNLGDLFSACYNHFKLSQTETLKLLGGITKEQIADAKDAWLQVIEAKL